MEPIGSHRVMQGVMATNTYGDLCPGSRHMEMVLRNLSAQEVPVPPKMVIGRGQTVEKVPYRGLLAHTGKDLPPSVQRELPEVSQTSGPESPEKGHPANPWVFPVGGPHSRT